MDDLISKQSVLELIKKSIVPEEYGCRLLYQSVEQMPSEQPEIIRCKDCKKNPSWEWVGCPMTGKNTRKPDDFCSYAERREDGT